MLHLDKAGEANQSNFVASDGAELETIEKMQLVEVTRRPLQPGPNPNPDPDPNPDPNLNPDTHHSPLTPHHSPLTTHPSPLTTHHPTLTLPLPLPLTPTQWFANNYKNFGADLEFVSDRSQEGSQFVRGFGGVGGILRYKVDFMEHDYDDESDDGNESD